MKKLLIMSIALVAIMATVFTVSAFAANTVDVTGISITEYVDPTTEEVNDAYVNMTVEYTVGEGTEGMDRITFMLSATTVADELEGNEAKVVYLDERVTPANAVEGVYSYSFVAEKARIKSALNLATIEAIEGQTLYFKMGGVGVDEADTATVVYNSPQSGDDVVYGDVDNSGGIDTYDSLLTLQHYVNNGGVLTSEQIVIANVDGSKNAETSAATIDTYDALLILQYYVAPADAKPTFPVAQ
jgi:hypothetical protein